MIRVTKKRLSGLLEDIVSDDMSVRISALDELSIIARKRGRRADIVLKRIEDDYGNAFSLDALVRIVRYHCSKIIRECDPDKAQKATITKIFRRLNPKRIEAEKFSRREVVFGLIDIALVMVLASLAVVCVVEATANSKFYRYHKAAQLVESGEYEDAAIAYEELGEYREAKERAESIHEKLGSRYLGQKDYSKAAAEYARAGENALDKYNYSIGFMCVSNDDYIDAYSFLSQVRNFSIEETLNRVILLAAKEYLEKGDVSKCRDMLYMLPEGYGIEEFTAEDLRNLIVVDRKWIEQIGRKSATLGTIGAYEVISGQCEGWKFDITKLPVNASISFEMDIADDMNSTMTVSVSYPVCAAYARDFMLQSQLITYNTVKKSFLCSEMSNVVQLDDNTQLIVADGVCQIKYHAEEMQIMPDDGEGNRALTVKESEITFN